ncbi:MAG: hypothetical protein IPL20_05470, partial [Saprospiraceae bacterium]|nr:hypothetical protein [Saprospiraceae bacterium]
MENYGSYSIGCVQLDPNNPNVVWVGTGEANNQRSVGYGDGICKSMDWVNHLPTWVCKIQNTSVKSLLTQIIQILFMLL